MTRPRLAAVVLAAALHVVALAAPAPPAASASLQGAAVLTARLTQTPQCCVIDARSAQHRQAAALPGALTYSAKLRIAPTSVVVVLADSDDRALAVARLLVKSSAHDVYAVKGGMPAWQSVLARLEAEAAKPGSKFGFVIPLDTCQQGEPLQVFEAQPARSVASAPR